jgi:hypothetical protein
MRLIELTRGQFAKVDDADYEWLMQWKWSAHLHECSASFYAERGSSAEGTISMQRQILGLKPGDVRMADHRDMDTLNNQHSNLRIASRFQNHMNRGVRKDSGTGIKGVSQVRGRYRVCIRAHNVRMHIGYFDSVCEAQMAYAKAAEKYHGEFARTA